MGVNGGYQCIEKGASNGSNECPEKRCARDGVNGKVKKGNKERSDNRSSTNAVDTP
jgi:hypothetical protein